MKEESKVHGEGGNTPIEVQPQIQTEKKKRTRTSTASMYSKTTAR